MTWLESWLWSGAITFAGLIIFWLWALRNGNPGMCDIIWTALFGIAAIFFSLTAPDEAWWPRQLLFTALICVWSFRLSWFFIDRVRRDQHDGRVEDLLADWGGNRSLALLWFYLFQGVFSLVFYFAYLFLLRDATIGFRLVEWLAVGLIVIGLWGEEVSNRQLRRFRRDPANRGKTCRQGLWRYSRHPNYFFQWVFWLALAVAAIGTSTFWVAFVAGPLVMYLLLRYGSGVPPTEKQSLKSRGEDYRRYQQETSPFFPWFPRKVPEPAG